MDIEQIIQWSRDAGFSVHDGVVTGGTFDLKAFAKLVAAHEREACAKVLEEIEARCIAKDVDDPPLEHVAAAIRARSN
jgi:hypothetical protein